jgi:hypothetical protein
MSYEFILRRTIAFQWIYNADINRPECDHLFYNARYQLVMSVAPLSRTISTHVYSMLSSLSESDVLMSRIVGIYRLLFVSRW